MKSSPRPNGLGLGFYLTCWDFHKDLVEVANEFFTGVSLPWYSNASFIVLITKVENPTNFKKFCHISLLCTVAYKIFSKIIVSQLSRYLHNIISFKQGAFISSCSIFDTANLGLGYGTLDQQKS